MGSRERAAWYFDDINGEYVVARCQVKRGYSQRKPVTCRDLALEGFRYNPTPRHTDTPRAVLHPYRWT